MRHITIVLVILMNCSFAFSQDKLKEKNVLGQWKLHIDIKEELKDESESENFFERIVAKGVSGLVSGIMDCIDIRFDFQKNNVLKVYADVPIMMKMKL